MRFNILGPLEITDDDGGPVAVTRRLHRSALTLLLLNAGQPYSASDLISALWGERPPLSPEVSLRSCVYGIRKVLPDARRLRTHPSGYLIQVSPGELDLHSFRALASQGREAIDRGDPQEAAALLAEALDLWREPAVADLPDVQEKGRLLDQRKEAQDALMDARLELGRHRQVLSELRSVVAADPLREHAWAQLMIALYRCGARAEALATFGKLRMTLVSTYGIEPGPELQDLHRQVLADDPELMTRTEAGSAGAHAGYSPGPPSWQQTCQLPAPVADFTGRWHELSELLNRLPGDGMAVTVVSGMPGVGKTELAVRAAHLAKPGFPGGQLCAWLDDCGQARDPQVVLGEFLRGLGVPPAGIPDGRFERVAMYRSVLAERRVLVLIDGATSAAQVRPLLPSARGSAVVVTSRSRLADLDGARTIELGGLLPDDSVGLLAKVCGRQQAGQEASGDVDAALAIATACGHLPLAVRIAGARLAGDPDLTMAELADLLADESTRLDELALGDQSVRARLAAAAGAVSGTARIALALLAAAGPRDAPGSLIASLLEDPSALQIGPALADAGLLHVVAGGAGAGAPTYRLHPLVRAYAGELLAETDPGIVGSATGRLVASGWLELANRRGGGRLLNLVRHSPPLTWSQSHGKPAGTQRARQEAYDRKRV